MTLVAFVFRSCQMNILRLCMQWMCKTFERLTKRKLGLKIGAFAQSEITDNAEHRGCGKSRCGHLIGANFSMAMVIAVATIPIVSTCNVRSKKNSQGCQKNESFQGSCPLRGTWSQTGNIVSDCGPGYGGIEQAAHQSSGGRELLTPP